jgi:hypothetical protein
MTTGQKKRTALAFRTVVTAAAVSALALQGAGIGNASASPSLSFDPWPGGLTVHIQERGGASTWCTYTADWYQSPRFPLKAFQTYDLVIVPSFPENRMWDVSVKCDAGNNTHTTYFY